MKPRRIAALRVLLETVRGDGTYELRHRLGALPRLFRSASSGSYRGWDSRRVLGLVVGAVYVLSPVDVVPEVVLGLFGLADDALVAAWLAGAVLAEVDGFLDWEKAEQKVVRGDVLR
jgi:uncharacterized membrane protein YkvA (DUF1232 family)